MTQAPFTKSIELDNDVILTDEELFDEDKEWLHADRGLKPIESKLVRYKTQSI